MPARLQIVPTIHKDRIDTVNLGTTALLFTNAEIGKAVKLTGAGTYGLCAAGDKIEGIVNSSEYSLTGATRGGLSVGGVRKSGFVEVIATVALAAGDKVVAAAQPAVGTKLTGIGNGDVPCTPVQKAAADAVAPFLMRVVDLGPVGTGAAGTICVAEFL